MARAERTLQCWAGEKKIKEKKIRWIAVFWVSVRRVMLRAEKEIPKDCEKYQSCLSHVLHSLRVHVKCHNQARQTTTALTLTPSLSRF